VLLEGRVRLTAWRYAPKHLPDDWMLLPADEIARLDDI
jgi:hypothetical protein